MEHLRIRPMVAADLDGPLFSERGRPSGEAWLARQEKQEVCVAVAEWDDVPVARLGLDLTKHCLWEAAYLWSAHVEADFQGRGIGTALIVHLEGLARARGYSAATLCVGKDNDRARNLYERLGYRLVGESIDRWTEWVDGQEEAHADPCWDLEKPLTPGAGLFQGLPRWPTRDAQVRLAQRMGVPPPDEWDQDWEWTVADESRFGDWLEVYKDPDLSDDERISLMETLIDCANGAEESMREALRPRLLARPALHAHTVHYWCAWNAEAGDPGQLWDISPWMREVWEQMRPLLAAERSRIQNVVP